MGWLFCFTSLVAGKVVRILLIVPHRTYLTPVHIMLMIALKLKD